VIVFVDSNIPKYVAGRPHAHQEPSRHFLDAVARKEIDACTSSEVLQEILYRYSALSRYDLARFRRDAGGYESRERSLDCDS